ncbi:MAG: malate/lactate/ureidoglycolate dehydrogenase [Actinomycetia bacterium]|nr:malate/lactate/ureidoglycolate dehydrogenase [Actinomycetes bacterium]
MRIQVEPLRVLVAEIFEGAGCSPIEARRIATSLVGANLTGHDSHGVIRVPRYVSWLEHDIQFADQEIEVLVDQGSLLLIDGHYGMGQTVGPQAVQVGMDRAQEHGHSIVALRHAGHLGRIGEYAEMAAARGLVSIHLVNVAGSKLVAPFGAISRRMGTNPLAFGVPRRGASPVIHDFATSVVAEGKVNVALHGGPAVPDNTLVDADGNLTGDPGVLYHLEEGKQPDTSRGTGALRAMGDHKGSGLSVMCELLAGALTGGGCAGPGDVPFSNGMLSIYLDPATIDPDTSFATDVADYVDWFLDARPIDSDEGVRLPGDKERERRATREAEGLELPDEAWAAIARAATKTGVTKDRVAQLASS